MAHLFRTEGKSKTAELSLWVYGTGGTSKIHAKVKDRNLALWIWRMKQARSANRTLGRFQSFIRPRDVVAYSAFLVVPIFCKSCSYLSGKKQSWGPGGRQTCHSDLVSWISWGFWCVQSVTSRFAKRWPDDRCEGTMAQDPSCYSIQEGKHESRSKAFAEILQLNRSPKKSGIVAAVASQSLDMSQLITWLGITHGRGHWRHSTSSVLGEVCVWQCLLWKRWVLS